MALNEKKDRAQYAKYQRALGKKNVPESFAKFQEIKYTKPEAWEDIKYYVANKGDRPLYCAQIDRELEKAGLSPGRAMPPEKIRSYILEDKDVKQNHSHIMERMLLRGITDDRVQSFIDKAVIRFDQRGGRRAYYSLEGVTVAKPDKHYANVDWIAKTTWDKSDFDENASKILEAAKKYGR